MAFKRIFRRLLCKPGSGAAHHTDDGSKLDGLCGRGGFDHNDNGTNGKAHGKANRVSLRRSPAVRNKDDGSMDGTTRYYKELTEQFDPFHIQEIDGKYVDVRDTFTPRPKWWTVPLKLIILIWTTTVFVDGFMATGPSFFYFATFAHLSLVVTLAYLICSFLCNILRSPSKTTDQYSDGKDFFPSVWLQLTWVLFAIAAPSQVLSALIFWCTEFPFQTFDLQGSLILYGTIWILLLAEGFWVNRVPLRVNHQWYFLGFYFLFLLWSLIHSYLGIGNPLEVNDVLYPFLQWNESPWFTVLYSMISLLIVAPLVFWFVWKLSLWSSPLIFQGLNRRYLSLDDSELVDMYVELHG